MPIPDNTTGIFRLQTASATFSISKHLHSVLYFLSLDNKFKNVKINYIVGTLRKNWKLNLIFFSKHNALFKTYE